MEQQQKEEEAKQKRIIANRESARRSRMRKQQYMDELEHMVSVLRAQVMSLNDELKSKNDIIQVMKEVTGISVNVDHHYNHHQSLCNQFLKDVCEVAKDIPEIPHSLIVDIMKEVQ